MAMPKTKRKKPRLPSERISKGRLQDPSWEGAEQWSGEKLHFAITLG